MSFKPTEDTPKRNYPIPAVVLPQEWSIIESSTPAVDILNGKMQVPLTDHSKDLAMRLHEMMHVKMSPKDKSAVKTTKNTIMAVSAFEDFRVNSPITPEKLRAKSRYRHYSGEAELYDSTKGIPDSIKLESIKHFLEDSVAISKAERIPPDHKALGVMSAGPAVLTALDETDQYEYEQSGMNNPEPWEDWWSRRNSDDAQALKEAKIDPRPIKEAVQKVCRDTFPVSEDSREQMERVMKQVMRSLLDDSTFDNVLKQSRLWARKFKLWREQEERQKETEHKLAGQANQTMGLGTEQEKETQKGMKEMMEQLSKTLDSQDPRQRRVPRFNRPQDLTLEEALEGIDFQVKSCKLEVYKPSILSRKRRPEYIGAVPKHMERLPFDGQVFERKVRGAGGSVLIDNSGSMCLRDHELELLVKKAPAVTVAEYSGDRGGDTPGGRGVLHILAAHGRMTDISKHRKCGGLNIVDVQSLEWLAKQRPPRIWVSDGGVTGKNHEHYRCVVERCVMLCLMNSIIRVPTVEKALDLFANEALFTERGRAMTREKLRWQHEEGGRA